MLGGELTRLSFAGVVATGLASVQFDVDGDTNSSQITGPTAGVGVVFAGVCIIGDQRYATCSRTSYSVHDDSPLLPDAAPWVFRCWKLVHLWYICIDPMPCQG